MIEIIIVVIYVIIGLYDQGEDCQDKTYVVESIRSAQYSVHVGASS